MVFFFAFIELRAFSVEAFPLSLTKVANKSQILKFELLIFHPILLLFLAKLLSLWVIDEP
jgi:hypothetical protein